MSSTDLLDNAELCRNNIIIMVQYFILITGYFQINVVYCSLMWICGVLDKCHIEEVTKIEGEASASNRKAKLIFFYEWVITAKWKGNVAHNAEDHDTHTQLCFNIVQFSPLDCSKRFTLHHASRPVHSGTKSTSGKHSSQTAITRTRVLTHMYTTVYSQVLLLDLYNV